MFWHRPEGSGTKCQFLGWNGPTLAIIQRHPLLIQRAGRALLRRCFRIVDADPLRLRVGRWQSNEMAVKKKKKKPWKVTKTGKWQLENLRRESCRRIFSDEMFRPSVKDIHHHLLILLHFPSISHVFFPFSCGPAGRKSRAANGELLDWIGLVQNICWISIKNQFSIR